MISIGIYFNTSKMKTINVNGRIFEYEIFSEYNECYTYYWTEFYEGSKLITRKKYWVFGKIISEYVPNYMFTLDFNIESPNYTKNEVRKKIERQIELLNRKKEIEKSEII